MAVLWWSTTLPVQNQTYNDGKTKKKSRTKKPTQKKKNISMTTEIHVHH